MRWKFVLCAALAALLVTPVRAVDLEDPDPEPAAAPEPEVPLPAYPQEKSLMQFDVGQANPNKFFVDTASIAPSGDGIVRYVVLIRTPSGIDNVSFEGLRCATEERRVYAIGRKDGTWSRLRNSAWGDLEKSDTRNRHQRVLAERYFCEGGIAIRSQAEGVTALKRNAVIPRKPYGPEF